jgi:hypothetical protein
MEGSAVRKTSTRVSVRDFLSGVIPLVAREFNVYVSIPRIVPRPFNGSCANRYLIVISQVVNHGVFDQKVEAALQSLICALRAITG